MPIQTEVWAADIKEKLFPDDSWMSMAQDDSQFVDNHKVHRAVAGEIPQSTRNRQTLPAQILRRTDEDADYTLDEFTTDPTLVRDLEEVEVNYNKRQSVLTQHVRQLNLDIANWMSYHWAPTPAANIYRTSGAARPAIATAFGATGNRKKLRIEDILKLSELFDDMEVPEEGRMALIPTGMYNDLVADNYKDILVLQQEGKAVLTNGEISGLFGFRLYKRGRKNLLTYTNAGTPAKRQPTASALTSANAALLAWHPEFVTRALGDVKAFANEDDATLYGSVFSALARAGGRQFYPDWSGVGAIVEDAA